MNVRRQIMVLVSLIALGVGALQCLPGGNLAGAAGRPAGAAPQQRPTLTPAPTTGPRPTLTPLAANRRTGAADIYLRLSTDPGGAIPPASVATYQLVALNTGRADAAHVRITLPLVPDVQTPLDAAFSNPSAWVSAVLTDAVELRVDALKRGQTITATLWLRISPAAPLGRDLSSRARLQWGGLDEGKTRFSNLAPLVVAQAPENGRPAALAIDSATDTAAFGVVYGGFASNERVSLWYHAPDSSVVSLGEVRADGQGRIAYRLATTTLGAGRYTIIAAGQYSQVSAVGTFAVS
jgi:hypothetical protein